jgi:hypothetical protein
MKDQSAAVTAGSPAAAWQAEQFVGAGRGEHARLAAGQDQAEWRAAQPLKVVHGHRAVVEPQRGEHRAASRSSRIAASTSPKSRSTIAAAWWAMDASRGPGPVASRAGAAARASRGLTPVSGMSSSAV